MNPAIRLHLFKLPDPVENAQEDGMPLHFTLGEQRVGSLRCDEPGVHPMLAHQLMGAGPDLLVIDHGDGS